MTKTVLSILFFYSLSSIACEDNLKPYAFECEIQDQYKSIASEFSTQFHIQAEKILNYKAQKFIDTASWNKSLHTKNFNPKTIYSPAPLTWDLWASMDNFVNELPLDTKISEELLKSIHLKAMTTDLMTFWSVHLKGARPGKIRSESSQRPPEYFYNCNDDKVSESLAEFLKNYDIKTMDHQPMISVNLYSCLSNDNVRTSDYSGNIQYLQSEKVPAELNYWISDYNEENMGSLSPVEKVADLQRKFVAIHPFGDGNGRMSRFLQDLYLKKWGLPAPISNLLQQDIITPTAQYRSNMKLALKKTIVILSSCLQEYKDQKISAGCKTEDEFMGL